jgi:hypothetical protein
VEVSPSIFSFCHVLQLISGTARKFSIKYAKAKKREKVFFDTRNVYKFLENCEKKGGKEKVFALYFILLSFDVAICCESTGSKLRKVEFGLRFVEGW